MSIDQQNYFAAAKRVVVKVGSNVLTAAHGLNLEAIEAISRQTCTLAEGGQEIILVSSGAMASGIKKLGLARRPDEIPKRQAVSAVGQAGLILEYEKAFARFNRKVAQVLLTRDDLTHRRRYLNARNTLSTLLSWKVIPIINENDTVMVEEIKFGDNDNLSALITLLMDADLLINLTDIDGLFTKDPRIHDDAQLIPVVNSIGGDIRKMANAIAGALGTGGMSAKINAAQKVTSAGIPMVIAQGDKRDILLRLRAGETHGTYFVPKQEKLPSRKCWIAYTLKPTGALHIDTGAAEALCKRGKSLLPSGITNVEGDFGVGAAVSFGLNGHEHLGIGLVNYSAADIRKIMGLRTSQIQAILGSKPYDEVIHRDNLALTGRSDT